MAHVIKHMPRTPAHVLVRIDGQLVVGNRQALKREILSLLEHGERHFVFDFARTGYIDASGLGVLVSMRKKIVEHGGDMTLRNLDDNALALFEFTKLTELFGIDERWEAA